MGIKSWKTKKTKAPVVNEPTVYPPVQPQEPKPPETKPIISMPSNSGNYQGQRDYSTDATADLMRLVGTAIDEWAVRHNMQGLPREIVFEQALAALNAWHKTMKR